MIYERKKSYENEIVSGESGKNYYWCGETFLAFTVRSALPTMYYVLTDANKNVCALVSESGEVVAKYDYTPFGKLLTRCLTPNVRSLKNSFLFSSEYHDEETGLVYYNYRYYNPELGRWMSCDPIGERGGLNLYGMVNNNPVGKWDYLGENFFDVSEDELFYGSPEDPDNPDPMGLIDRLKKWWAGRDYEFLKEQLDLSPLKVCEKSPSQISGSGFFRYKTITLKPPFWKGAMDRVMSFLNDTSNADFKTTEGFGNSEYPKLGNVSRVTKYKLPKAKQKFSNGMRRAKMANNALKNLLEYSSDIKITWDKNCKCIDRFIHMPSPLLMEGSGSREDKAIFMIKAWGRAYDVRIR